MGTDVPATRPSNPDDATYYNIQILEQRSGDIHWTVRQLFPPPPGQTWPFESFAALAAQAPGVARALLEGRLTVEWHREGAGTMYECALSPSDLAQDFPVVTAALAAQGVVLQ